MGSLTGIISAMLSAACFGMLAVLGKLAYARGFEAAEILQYRFGFGALMLLVWFAATNRSVLRAGPKTLLKAGFLGVVLYPVQSLSFMSSLKYVPAATSSLILYFYPVAVTLLSALIFRTRLDRVVGISLLLLVAGCGLVFFDAFLRDISRTGLMLATLSMLIFSTYLICLEWLLRGENPITVSFYCVLAASIVWTIVSPPVRFMEFDMQTKALTLALGLVPTALAVTLLYRSVDLIGSSSASICSTLEPITTVLASALLLGEAVMPIQIAGMALILFGIVLPNAQAARLKRS
ncbi:MAG: DMT family transporter [Desulfovibrio sp.]